MKVINFYGLAFMFLIIPSAIFLVSGIFTHYIPLIALAVIFAPCYVFSCKYNIPPCLEFCLF